MSGLDDLLPCEPKDVIRYRGVSQAQALKGGTFVICGETMRIDGFRPDVVNKPSMIVYTKKPCDVNCDEHCGVLGTDYGFVDAGGITHGIIDDVIVGRTCCKVTGKVKPSLSKPIKGEDGWYTLKSIGKATFSLSVQTEIYYVKTDWSISGIDTPVSVHQSEDAYLHELGHLLDIWSVIPMKGKRISELYTETFYGPDETYANAKAKIYYDHQLKIVIANHEDEIRDLGIKYHNNIAGFDGNPWTKRKCK